VLLHLLLHLLMVGMWLTALGAGLLSSVVLWLQGKLRGLSALHKTPLFLHLNFLL